MIRVRDGERETMMSMEEFEARARAGELSPLSYVCIPALTGDRFVQARELPLFVSLYDPRRIHFRRHFSIDRLPIVTGLVALLAIGLFLYARQMGDGVITREALLLLGAKAKARIVEDGETWRILAANLLHRDALHLGFNLFALGIIGAVLEGVYRRGDFILLLVVSGVVTMGASAAIGATVTVGASGLVFGCLGAAVIFGWRYADVLPFRYRIYFGVVVVIYAAAMFYLGLRSASTDNWGHAGGLLAGVGMGLVLTPRLLRLTEAREPTAVLVQPYLIAALLALLVTAIGPLIPTLFLRYEIHRSEAFGVRLERPRHWNKRVDEMGLLTFGNGVDAFTKLGCARLEGPSRIDEAAGRFIDGELRRSQGGGYIGDLVVDPPARAVVGSGSAAHDAMRVPFSFLASDGRWEAEAYLFSRGQLECALVLGAQPGAPESVRARLDRIRLRVTFEDTSAERQAQARAEGSEEARDYLALALQRQAAGHYARARDAFDIAARLALNHSVGLQAEIAYARARFEHAYTGDLAFAEVHAARAFALRPSDPDAGLLLGDILVARGDPEGALNLLERLDKMYPSHPKLVGARERWSR